MNITQTITLDLSQVGVFTAVNAKQGDDQTRFVRAVILNGGMVWQAPEGTSAGFRCVKPDGHSCQNPAVINDDGTVTLELTAQVLAVPGTVWADICFINAAGEVLSTASFAIYVAGVPQGQNIPSSNEFLTLVDMVSRGEAALAELGRAEGGLEDLRQRVANLENAPDEGGVSSWEDLTDRPFTYTEGGGTDLLPEQTLQFADMDDGSGMYNTVVQSAGRLLTAGETYAVIWDGVEYTFVCQTVSMGDEATEFIGNTALVGGEETEDPMGIAQFAVALEDGTVVYIVTMVTPDTSESHTVALKTGGGGRWVLNESALPMEAIEAKIEEIISSALEGDY